MAPRVCCLTIGLLCMAPQVCCLTIGFLCVAPQVCCLTIGFLCMATQVCFLTIGFLCMAPQMFMMEMAEAWKRRKHGNGRRMETAEAWKRRKHGNGGSMIAPHDTLLLSLRFAIPHQPLIVRCVSCFHFGSRYPTSVVVCDVARVFISLLDTPPAHQPGGQNSDQ